MKSFNDRTSHRTLEKVLKAVANRRRLAILSYFRKAGEAAVWDISAQIKLSIKATSKHLGVLRGADLVFSEQRSAEVFYCVASDMPAVIQTLLHSL